MVHSHLQDGSEEATVATGHKWIPSMKEVMLKAANTTNMLGKKSKERLISFALAYNGPEKLDEFTAECKRFAGLDIILLGMVQSLSVSERFFLGQLAKKMMK